MLIPAPRVFLSTRPVDLRKSYQTLSVVVKDQFGEDPLSGSMFVFYNRSKDRLKIVYWGGNGFCLWMKRLEQGRFCLPVFEKGLEKIPVSSYQVQGLMQGLNGWQSQEEKPLFYQHF